MFRQNSSKFVKIREILIKFESKNDQILKKIHKNCEKKCEKKICPSIIFFDSESFETRFGEVLQVKNCEKIAKKRRTNAKKSEVKFRGEL